MVEISPAFLMIAHKCDDSFLHFIWALIYSNEWILYHMWIH